MPVRESSGFVTRSDGSQATVVRLAGVHPGASEVELVAAVAARKIRVLSYVLSALDPTGYAVFTYDQPGSTEISGRKYIPASGGIVAGYHPHGHFESATGKNLQLNVITESTISYEITYITV